MRRGGWERIAPGSKAKVARIGWTRVGESRYRAPGDFQAGLVMARAVISAAVQKMPCLMWCSACLAAHPLRMRPVTRVDAGILDEAYWSWHRKNT